jgi:hypothetical protein
MTHRGQSRIPHFGVWLISIRTVEAVAHSLFVDQLSNPPTLVRLGADNRHIAGQ